MNFKQGLLWCGSSLLLGGIFLPITVSAQSVASDRTLSTTVTSPDNRNFTITNGNQPNNGANLFHSFSQFQNQKSMQDGCSRLVQVLFVLLWS